MPVSNFSTLDSYIDNEDGTITYPNGAQVKAFDVTHNTELGVVGNTDANGILAGGTLPVVAGTRVRFRIENYQGWAGCEEKVTT
jgi:hypothetical protein